MFLKTLKVASISTFCVLATITMFSGNVLAYAQTSSIASEPKLNSRPKSETDKLIKNLKDKDPQKLESQKLEKKSDKTKNSSDQNTLVSSQNELTVETELKTKKIKVKNTDKGDISLNLPNSDQVDSVDVVDNKVIYSGKNSPIDTIVESIDGGVRQVINIKDSSAPSFYDFKVDLEKGDKLELTSEGEAIVKSSKVDEISKQPIIKTFILKPWAKDADGKDLTASYSIINGNTLRQTINLKGAVFPVTADPIWCGNAFSDLKWEDRPSEGGLTLRIKPTDCGRKLTSNPWNIETTFRDVIANVPYDSAWPWSDRDFFRRTSKYWSMYKQYYCHADIAFWKDTWNIEPWRPDRNWYSVYNSWINGKLIPCNQS